MLHFGLELVRIGLTAAMFFAVYVGTNLGVDAKQVSEYGLIWTRLVETAVTVAPAVVAASYWYLIHLADTRFYAGRQAGSLARAAISRDKKERLERRLKVENRLADELPSTNPQNN